MNRTHIGLLEQRISDHHAKTEAFKEYIDGTISQLEMTIAQAEQDIRNLTAVKNALSFSTLPDYVKPEPEMPKAAELPNQEPSQMQTTLDDDNLTKQLEDGLGLDGKPE